MAFIFIGRGGRTPSKSGYKQILQLRSNLIRITQEQTGLTGRRRASSGSDRRDPVCSSTCVLANSASTAAYRSFDPYEPEFCALIGR